jgi:iron(III) transport system permease protein
VLERLAVFGHALPGAVLAVGLAVPAALLDSRLDELAQTNFDIDLAPVVGGGLSVLLLAYVIRFLAVSFGATDGALRRVTPNLVESARSLGVHGFALWREVRYPLVRGGLSSAFLLAFAEMAKELPVILLARPEGWDTLALQAFALAAAGNWQRAALPALALVLTALAALLSLVFLIRRAENRHA